MKIKSDEIRTIISNSTQFRGELDEDAIFTESGIDSLDLFSILMAIEEKYAIKIPDEDATDLRSIRAVLEYLEKRIG